eukprot:1484633-Prorocentrum_lima.AAC.1
MHATIVCARSATFCVPEQGFVSVATEVNDLDLVESRLHVRLGQRLHLQWQQEHPVLVVLRVHPSAECCHDMSCGCDE